MMRTVILASLAWLLIVGCTSRNAAGRLQGDTDNAKDLSPTTAVITAFQNANSGDYVRSDMFLAAALRNSITNTKPMWDYYTRTQQIAMISVTNETVRVVHQWADGDAKSSLVDLSLTFRDGSQQSYVVTLIKVLDTQWQIAMLREPLMGKTPGHQS